MSSPSNATGKSSNLKGIAFMVLAIFVFSTQDGITRLLAEHYHPILIVMIRYWAFAAFVIGISAMRPGGVGRVMLSAHPIVQFTRGLMLAFQICLVTFCFTYFGLGTTHAILAAGPLLIAAGGAVFLGERVSILQWIAIVFGFTGVIVLLNPTGSVIDPLALIPLFCAAMFATYSLLTRWVGRRDQPATSFFYTGIGGAIGMSIIGPMFWTDMAPEHWGWMAALCVLGASGHFLLIKAYENAEAASLQPFAYMQLAITSMIGITFFGEVIESRFLIGSGIIVTSGLIALYIGRQAQRKAKRARKARR